MTRVLPEPAPAAPGRGPSPRGVAAASCSDLSSWAHVSGRVAIIAGRVSGGEIRAALAGAAVGLGLAASLTGRPGEGAHLARVVEVDESVEGPRRDDGPPAELVLAAGLEECRRAEVQEQHLLPQLVQHLFGGPRARRVRRSAAADDGPVDVGLVAGEADDDVLAAERGRG